MIGVPSTSQIISTHQAPLHPVLLGPSSRLEARELVYEVYHRELAWAPGTPNPSKLIVDHERGMYCDRFDSGALWIGIRAGDKLVGAARLLRRSVFGSLELESYTRIPADLLIPSEIVEPNRLAILRSHRGPWALLVLQLAIEAVAVGLGARRAFGAMSQRNAKLVSACFGWRHVGEPFRYHPNEPAPVQLIVFDEGDRRPPGTLSSRVTPTLERTLAALEVEARDYRDPNPEKTP